MRFQSAQLDAYLTDGLWLRLAATANRAMAVLAAGLRELDIELLHEPDVNMLFVACPTPRPAPGATPTSASTTWAVAWCGS